MLLFFLWKFRETLRSANAQRISKLIYAIIFIFILFTCSYLNKKWIKNKMNEWMNSGGCAKICTVLWRKAIWIARKLERIYSKKYQHLTVCLFPQRGEKLVYGFELENVGWNFKCLKPSKTATVLENVAQSETCKCLGNMHRVKHVKVQEVSPQYGKTRVTVVMALLSTVRKVALHACSSWLYCHSLLQLWKFEGICKEINHGGYSRAQTSNAWICWWLRMQYSTRQKA